MTHELTLEEREDAKTIPTGTLAMELVAETLGGAAVGALTGMVGGPPGMAIGAVFGGAVGVMAGEAAHMGSVEVSRDDAALDRVIGVFGGNLGEASRDQPPSEHPLHPESLGLETDPMPEGSDGPIQSLDA